MSTSANGATLTGPTSTGALVDSSNVVWTLTAGVVYRNGVATVSNSVILLLYYGGAIYQQNINKNWWQWVANGWVASADPWPPLATTITLTLGTPYILTVGGASYAVTLVATSPIQTDGAKDITTDG